MALMKFREPNQVRWQGVRPAHNGEQVANSNMQNGNGERILYTVPAGKVLFLTFLDLSCSNTAVANCRGLLIIYDDTLATWGVPLVISFQAAGRGSKCIAFSFPIELAAAWSICISNNNVGVVSYGGMFGWIENV